MDMDAKSKSSEIFQHMLTRGAEIAHKEPLISPYLEHVILSCSSFDMALARLISSLLSNILVKKDALYEICMEAMTHDSSIATAAANDIIAVSQRDPAVGGDYTMPFLYFKGFQALQSYRIGHWLYSNDRHEFALYLQSVISHVFAVDIHPEAKIGSGIMLDHGTSIVIGQTAVVADDVSIMQEVTLGGTGKECGDRHPKVAKGVLIGAGAKILGNIHIGEGSKVGAGSVVLSDVQAHTTVAGIPARVVGKCASMPSHEMNQGIEAKKICSQACALDCDIFDRLDADAYK